MSPASSGHKSPVHLRWALVRLLRRCPEESPRYEQARALLAAVMAEEQARRLTGRASGITLTVPRIRM